MIEILDPEKITVPPWAWKAATGWHYQLDYPWIVDQVKEFSIGEETILDVGSAFSLLSIHLEELGYTVKTLDRTPDGLHDYKGDFLDVDFGEDRFDVILWASSIEHQETIEKVEACYLKSMDLLLPGGFFVATFPIALETAWFEPARQWNISKRDAMRIYNTDTVKGNYENIWEVYRSNKWDLRTRYVNRFNVWNGHDPEYLAAGVVVVKTTN